MSAPRVAESPHQLLSYLSGIAAIEGERLVIEDEAAFRSSGIRDVVWTATFSGDEPTVEAARWIVWEASQELGSPSASIHELYMARARGEYGGWTVPAINLRTQVFDMAAAGCRAAMELDAGSVIFELARSEQEYTFQRPGEYITSVLAGCIAAGWRGPVFVQGDHYQFNAAKYKADPEGVTDILRKATVNALSVGYGNIDIDSSTLVDLSLPTLDEQQQVNYTRAAELSALIREHQDEGLFVSIGGEIGEVGKQNSTPDELRAYLQGYRRELEARAGGDAIGLAKVSVQTGTSHGGVPLPGGGVAEVKLDFETLRQLGEVAREHGLAGAVQHGASTLPDELFHRFPQVETAEIHLATGFQNALYEHEAFPADLYAAIESFCHANCADERKDGETDTQFVYKTRKKALGTFKRRLWELVCLTARIPLVDGSIRRAQRTRSRFHPLNTGLHLARLVVANSYAGLRAYDIPPRRGRVVHNGFDPDRFRFSQASPRSDDRVAVVMTGRMVPQKDYATFFAAARYLTAADSRAWQFVAVGEGPDRGSLIAENQDLVDAQVASFPHGGLEVMGVLSGCHIGVLMTNPELHAEGCSNSILEYMACALPVVCGDSGGNRELVGDGKTGFIVPAREPRILAQRLLELRDEPELRRRMGDAGKAALMERFSVDRMIGDLVRVYEEAVRNRAGGSTTALAGRAAGGG